MCQGVLCFKNFRPFVKVQENHLFPRRDARGTRWRLTSLKKNKCWGRSPVHHVKALKIMDDIAAPPIVPQAACRCRVMSVYQPDDVARVGFGQTTSGTHGRGPKEHSKAWNY